MEVTGRTHPGHRGLPFDLDSDVSFPAVRHHAAVAVFIAPVLAAVGLTGVPFVPADVVALTPAAFSFVIPVLLGLAVIFGIAAAAAFTGKLIAPETKLRTALETRSTPTRKATASPAASWPNSRASFGKPSASFRTGWRSSWHPGLAVARRQQRQTGAASLPAATPNRRSGSDTPYGVAASRSLAGRQRGAA
ncbi:hypothetical protein [Arthrobacter sp. ZGTC412]|uniref:hypothetical protein n=1 Tax=Arthrobacter sp. ZGTC412 TaxID=2058900 RepID=UPI0015E46722|nr:hypothetical protein [Arthrobacter sp. ZGTC412]